MNLITIIVGVACLIIGAAVGYLILKSVANGAYNKRLAEAEKEAQVIKQNKLLEVKVEFFVTMLKCRCCVCGVEYRTGALYVCLTFK